MESVTRCVTPMPTATPRDAERVMNERSLMTPMMGGDPSGEICYATVSGLYYHRREDCSGMLQALPWTRVSAQAVGKLPCPVCLPEEAERYAEGNVSEP